MKKTVYYCDRCQLECPGVSLVDTGNDYSEGRDESGLKKRVAVDLCSTCLLELREWLKSRDSQGPRTEEK